MKIGDKVVGKDFIFVAEAGSTIRGSVETAKKLATGAKDAEADAIKFIVSDADDLMSEPIEYEGQDLAEVIKSFQISDDDWREVVRHCKEIDLPYFFSVGTPNYTKLTVELGTCCLKLGGWETRNKYLIDSFLETGLPLMIDLGAVVGGEVWNLLDYMKKKTCVEWLDDNVTLIYESHSSNPEEFNLAAIDYLQDKFNLPVGFSSDSGNAADYLAVEIGAKVLEKRIKLDDEHKNAHHEGVKAIAIDGLAEYVKQFSKTNFKAPKQNNRKMLGDYGLFPSMADIEGKMKYFTSLVYDKDMKAGEVITREHLAARRPATGFSPFYDYLWLNKPLKSAVRRNQMVALEHV